MNGQNSNGQTSRKKKQNKHKQNKQNKLSLKDEFAEVAKTRDRFNRQYELLQKVREYEKNDRNFKAEEYLKLFDA